MNLIFLASLICLEYGKTKKALDEDEKEFEFSLFQNGNRIDTINLQLTKYTSQPNLKTETNTTNCLKKQYTKQEEPNSEKGEKVIKEPQINPQEDFLNAQPPEYDQKKKSLELPISVENKNNIKVNRY